MNSKKLITLLVLTTLILSMVPFTMAATNLSDATFTFDNLDSGLTSSGEKGNDIEVTSDAGAVASGYEVMLYWDKIQSWDGEKGLLNTSEPDDDGSIEIWFTVPEATKGGHTLWFTATDQENKRSVAFTVIPDCDIDTSSGLAGSKVITDLWGFAKDKEVSILFIESDQLGTPAPYDYDEYNAWTLTDAPLYEIADAVIGIYPDVPLRYDPADCTSILLELDSPTAPTGTATWNGAAWGTYVGAITAVVDNLDGTVDITVSAAQTIGDMFYATYDVVVDNDDGELKVDEYETGEDKYDGTLDNDMIQPGTIVWDIEAHATINDVKAGAFVPDGNLWWEDAVPAWKDVGNINYVSGEWTLDLGVVTGLLNGDDMDVVYATIEEYANHINILTSSGVTNNLGTYENKRVTIPSPVVEGQYYVVGLDGKNNRASDDFEIGAVISLSEDTADVGDKFEVTGEGFPPTVTLTCEIWRNDALVSNVHIIGSDGDDDETDGTGDFAFDIIVPQVSKKADDYEIRVKHATSGTEAGADLEITDLASISVDPDFGPQGSSITVSGENFQNIKDKKVKIELTGPSTATIEAEVKLESDGSFEVDTTVPTENDDTYDIVVTALDDDDGDFYIEDDSEFRIGTIMVLLSKDESVVGDRIILTGNGFTASGEWNATFGDVTIFEEEQAVTGLLKVDSETPQFFVPQLEPGVYTITVWDVEAEIMVETEFEITEYTVLDFELVDAPNEFNVSISGRNWPEVTLSGGLSEADEIKFVLWNETDEWDMEVIQYGPHDIVPPIDNPGSRDQDPAVLNATGFLNDAWWIVLDDETLDKGTYWINATIETDNEQEYFMQLEFVVGDVHVHSAPRKATFRLGDTVSFRIQHTFGNDANQPIKGGDIKVYDPDGELYWDGDPLNTWSKVQTWYEAPTSSQTASGNPMLLLDDAPLGTWSYKWREDNGDVIEEGTFNVEASAADIIGEQIEDLNSAIDDLTSDISAVTDAVAGVQSNVNSAIAAANAAVEAANAAVQAVNAVAATAGDAATAAQNAADAATDAKNAASGLTTLVYGAIGASLVAALAAIVSLMQISRRIAG